MADRAIYGGFCVVRRPKLGSIVGFHSGVLFTDGMVADLDPKRGVELVRLEEFACGHGVQVVRGIDRSLEHEARQRVLDARAHGRRYHILDWNCETFANWVTGAKPVSRDVVAWTAIALAIALLAVSGS